MEKSLRLSVVNVLKVEHFRQTKEPYDFYGPLDPIPEDFAVKIDFHYSDVTAAEGWIRIGVGDEINYVSISVDSDSNQSYF